MEDNLNKIIVVGNLYDERNEYKANGRVYSGGGIAPTLGSCHFQTDKWIIEITRLEDGANNSRNEGQES